MTQKTERYERALLNGLDEVLSAEQLRRVAAAALLCLDEDGLEQVVDRLDQKTGRRLELAMETWREVIEKLELLEGLGGGERSDEELIAVVESKVKVGPARKRRKAPKPSSFSKDVEVFVDDSLSGRYWELSMRKNERGFYETPESTDAWCRKVKELCAGAFRLSRKGEHEVVAEGLEHLLDLMHKTQDGHDIVWAEEWGVDWKVDVDFKRLLRTFFSALSKTAQPEDFASRGTAIAELWTWQHYDSDKLLRASAKGEYRKALERVRT